MQSQEEIDKEENNLRNIIQELPNDRRKILYSRLEKEIKDPDTYAVLNWLFIAGIHHFYLKKWLNGTINIIVFLVAFLLLFLGNDILLGLGIGMLITLFIVELNQLFRSQLILQDYNNNVTKKLLDKLILC